MQRLIVCSDGTWNSPDSKYQTNVKKLYDALRHRDRDGVRQHKFYDPGVGTAPGERLLGGLTGYGISQNIRDAYRFLVYHYNASDALDRSDEIYLFGFSRGAYTARSVAGMLRNSGLLKPQHLDRLDEAYALYRDRDPASKPGSDQAITFRAKYCHEVRIKCLGIWDTVGSLGIPLGRFNPLQRANQFHDLKLSNYIDNAFHAVALDERRSQFKPTLWQADTAATGQTVEQVWFAGVHSNVGGGYACSGLSDLAFEWMVERSRNLGLAYDDELLAATLRPDCRGQLYDSKAKFYKIFKDHVRPVGCQMLESVHVSALERRQALDAAYRAPNLDAYLKTGAPVITR